MSNQAILSVSLVMLLCIAAVVLFWPQVPAAAQGEAQAVGSGPRWEIHEVEMAWPEEQGEPEASVTNTILLDSHTGNTWILWTSQQGEHGYVWLKVERKGD